MDSDTIVGVPGQPQEQKPVTGRVSVNSTLTKNSSIEIVLSDFGGIGYIPHPSSRNASSVLDTGTCRRFSLGALSRNSHVESTSWEQRACMNRTMSFAEAEGQNVDVVFLGDDNIKLWVTSAPDSWAWMSGRVVNGSIANLGCERMPVVSGMEIAWRLMEHSLISPKVWVVSLGLNDCIDGRNYVDVATQLQEVVQVLRFYNCYSQVVVSGILPVTLSDQESAWEKATYRTCIQNTNALMKRFAKKNSKQGVSFVDCSSLFLSIRGDKVDTKMMPNGLHLSHAGYTKYAACLSEHMIRYSGLERAKYSPGFDFVSKPQQSPEWKAQEYTWTFSSWSPCSASCSSGSQFRTASCEDVHGNKVEDGKCDAGSLVVVRQCDMPPCETFNYLVYPWGRCSKDCGNGTALRNVTCTSSTGIPAEDISCSGADKPASVRVCNVQPCEATCGHDGSCSGNGKCEHGKCKCKQGFAGAWCHVEPDCASGVPSRSGCCASGNVASDGSCAPINAAVDGSGKICKTGSIDACGICNGKGKSVDVFGHCCEEILDASGICCKGSQIDECGVCNGSSASCALMGQANSLLPPENIYGSRSCIRLRMRGLLIVSYPRVVLIYVCNVPSGIS